MSLPKDRQNHGALKMEIHILKKLTPKDIKKMDYNELIAITKETNRPPGGLSSLITIINNIAINEKKRILEVGTSTGFTSLELCRITGCKAYGIDINKLSIEEARRRARKLKIKNIYFKVGTVEELNFPNNYFDIVIIGNVFSLVKNKEKALSECMRVLKNNGYLVAIPMYYVKIPPKKTVSEVSSAIKIPIKVLKKIDWENFFKLSNLEFFRTIDYIFEYIPDYKVRLYINKILSSPHLNKLKGDTKKNLEKRYSKFIKLFRNNLSYMGYSIFILRKNKFPFDEELFIGKEIKK